MTGKKNVPLDEYQLQWVADLVYEEWDRVRSGNTVYGNKQETLDDLQEILDLFKEVRENGA